MGEFIELENGGKFMILSAHVLDGEKYFYLASVSEDVRFIFAKLIDNRFLEPVEDGELNARLLKLVADKLDSKK